MVLPRTQLGKDGPEVTVIGYGAMGISAFYEPKLDDEAAFAVLDKAVELGCTFWDTARIYNNNEEVIGRWFAKTGKRSEIFLCTKFGIKPDFSTDGSPDYVKKSCEESLQRLGVKTIDLFYQHRMDQSLPIEVTVGAMAELVKQGKVKYLGLSECSAATLRRAYAVHPITAVQIEYSPFAVEAEQNGLIEACNELGVAVVAYSPLSRGFLTGAYTKPEDFPEGDYRRNAPRFQKENFDANLKLLDEFKHLATKKNATPGQMALAWLIAKGAIPIPGTTKIARLEENINAAYVQLTKEEFDDINEFVQKSGKVVAGARYSSSYGLYADTPELK
ncbi:NADP-dependent oxidoreductase domain-containing protein [Lipomyces tetrasporus]|uniref:NADP-dependent oxidoreductase domain-containing protein n=1 Tax=Lipomyces tetrasporus TaxID=54092 RepID=A0AAD7QY18_9ASCO|nr:NADP-dependent oxidoreductase domain-containing protein [Lipomyces tetrasporus]KAJ8103535.1 NADP-dependent oxidoreductase domain-containing protein [Lipomyces tetrasporus]